MTESSWSGPGPEQHRPSVPAPHDADGPAGEKPPPDPVFGDLETWMLAYFLPVFCRPVGGTIRWCHDWHLHPEAVIRLTVCWQAWELARQEGPAEISAWLRDDLDYHLSVLTDPRGPFYQCSPDEGGHLEPRPFPSSPSALTAADADLLGDGAP